MGQTAGTDERQGNAASEWSDAEAGAHAGRGPRWVVLGDTTGQGPVGTAALGGYVAAVLDRLRADDPSWQVVSLARAGATTAHVLDEQLPRLERLPRAALVSCNVGANDLARMWTRGVEGRIREITERLPAGSILATVPRGVKDRRAIAVNTAIREAAGRHALVVADVWAHSGTATPAPGDEGSSRPWREAFLAALDAPT